MQVLTLDVQEADLLVTVTDDAAVSAAAANTVPVDIVVNSAGVLGQNVALTET